MGGAGGGPGQGGAQRMLREMIRGEEASGAFRSALSRSRRGPRSSPLASRLRWPACRRLLPSGGRVLPRSHRPPPGTSSVRSLGRQSSMGRARRSWTCCTHGLTACECASACNCGSGGRAVPHGATPSSTVHGPAAAHSLMGVAWRCLGRAQPCVVASGAVHMLSSIVGQLMHPGS